MENTTNYNLNKPGANDNYNVVHQNQNMDIIDENLKANADDIATKETPDGAAAKATAAAGAALDAANDYTDQEVGEAKGLIGTLAQLATTVKANIVAAINEIVGRVDDVEDAQESHEADYATQIALIKDKIGIAPFVKSWEEVQAIVRAGLAEEYFEIGDQFLSMYDGKVIVWTIIGIDHDTPTDTEYSHSLTIQTRDCLDNVQFDAPEPTNPDANRQQYGNNRYIHSAIKQWLNSDETSFTWVSQHEYDEAPTGAPYDGAGYLARLDPELVEVIGAVDKQVAVATVDGGGQDTFSDKVFLLSRVEVYGGDEGTVTGESPYAYYANLAGAPTTDAIAGRIKLLSETTMRWWLRSPHVDRSHHPRHVGTPGTVSNSHASSANGLAPACCII